VQAAVSVPSASLATAADRPELEALRHRVFVEEQAVPVDHERDELDDGATHAVARDRAGRVVGTGRLVVSPAAPGGGAVGRIGRMAVAPEARGEGVGAALLAVLEAAAGLAGCRQVDVHAQVQAAGFYRRAGYLDQGEPFEEAGIAHVAMWKTLPDAPTLDPG
jgi:predicted GNAT family N-acyltransferase